MRKPNLQKLLTKWQRRLRLQDFDISIRYASAEEMQGTVGMCELDWKNGCFDIKIVEPKANTHSDPNFHNIELTIVHELMHIILQPLLKEKEPDLYDQLVEQSIEKLAKGFLEV